MSAHPLSTPPLPSPLCLAGPPEHPASLCLAGLGRARGLNQGERMLSALQRQPGFYQHPQKPLLELGISSLWEFLCLWHSPEFCWSHRVPLGAAELGAGPQSWENWDLPGVCTLPASQSQAKTLPETPRDFKRSQDNQIHLSAKVKAFPSNTYNKLTTTQHQQHKTNKQSRKQASCGNRVDFSFIPNLPALTET